jgi:hypothetical protein
MYNYDIAKVKCFSFKPTQAVESLSLSLSLYKYALLLKASTVYVIRGKYTFCKGLK